MGEGEDAKEGGAQNAGDGPTRAHSLDASPETRKPDGGAFGAIVGFWRRLRPRKIVQWGAAYIVLAFGLLQGVSLIEQTMGWPQLVTRGALVALVTGFPIALVLAWFHGDRGRQRIDRLEAGLISLCLLAGVGLAALTLHPPPGEVADVAASAPRLAVLRFESLGDTEPYFAEGVADELISEISRVHGMDVTARASSFALSGERATPANAARELGATLVLTGSVRRLQEAIRVNAELSEAPSGRRIWGDTFERPPTNAFALQRAIAVRVAQAAGARVAAPPPRRVDAQAYRLYLEGRERLLRSGIAGDNEGARDLLRDAVDRDPNFAEAWGALARAEASVAQEHFIVAAPTAALTPEALAPAMSAANRAIALDETLWTPWDVKAEILSQLGRWREAEDASERAHRLGVASDGFLRQVGRVDDALTWNRRAVELDPLDAHKLSMLSILCELDDNVDCQLDAAQRARDLDPDDAQTMWQLFRALNGRQERAQARALLSESQALLPALFDIYKPMNRQHLAWFVGDASPMTAAHITSAVDRGAGYVDVSVEMLADLGQWDAAATLLARWGAPNRPFLYSLYKRSWAPLRRTPHFWALVEREGLLLYWRQSRHWPDFCQREPVCDPRRR